MAQWLIVGGGTAGCVVARRLAEGRPGDEVVVLEADARPGGAALVNAGLVVGDPSGYRHRLPLEPPIALGALGSALLAAHPAAAPALLARRGGRPVTVADVYLGDPPPNLTVRTGVGVDRVAILDHRAVGVTTTAGEHVAAERVVVCSGAVGTPALLLRSGVDDLPGLGTGLQDHPGCALAVELIDGSSDSAAPDVAVTVELPEHQIVALERVPGSDGLGSLLAGYMAPVGTGSVSVPDPDGPAVVSLDRTAAPADLAGLRAAFDEAVRIANHPAVASVTGRVYVDAHGTRLEDLLVGGDDAVERWLSGTASPYHHMAGTCRAGVATDDVGGLRRYAALAVCDASLLPGVPRRNPYLSVIDLAERLSSAWLEGLRR